MLAWKQPFIQRVRNSSLVGVGFPPAERPRFPGQCQSSRGQSGPKAKPSGEADGMTVNIPSLPYGATRGRRSDTAAG